MLIVGCALTALRLNWEDRGNNVLNYIILPLYSQSTTHNCGDDDDVAEHTPRVARIVKSRLATFDVFHTKKQKGPFSSNIHCGN